MKVITTRKECPNMCEGEMIANGTVFQAYPYPPYYDHKCVKCGIAEAYKLSYPITITEYNEHEKEERWE